MMEEAERRVQYRFRQRCLCFLVTHVMFPLLAHWRQLTALFITASALSTETCFEDKSVDTLESLFQCFDKHVVQHYTRAEYEFAQPNNTELKAWTGVIQDMLEGQCNVTDVPAVLATDFALAEWGDHCILNETNVPFRRGWATFAASLKERPLLPNLHLMAPHPLFDGRTSAQGAYLLNATEARSLLVSARHRKALPEATDCQPGKFSYITDPTHDTVSGCSSIHERVLLTHSSAERAFSCSSRHYQTMARHVWWRLRPKYLRILAVTWERPSILRI